jgi:F-type H+-transporting ATPase subunit b
MDIYPNITVFIQIANFLILLFVLNIVFYRPIRKILGRRSEEVRDLNESIVDFREKSDQCDKELDESYKGARDEGFIEKEKLTKAGAEAEKEIIQGAISSAETKIGKAKDEIDRNVIGIRQSLEDELNMFSKELAEKMLGRNV